MGFALFRGVVLRDLFHRASLYDNPSSAFGFGGNPGQLRRPISGKVLHCLLQLMDHSDLLRVTTVFHYPKMLKGRIYEPPIRR